MACSLSTIQASACTSGIGKQTDRIKLLQWIAQLTCEASQAAGSGGAVWGFITGTLTNQADLVAALVALRPLTGVGSPIGSVTPAYIGQFYTDSAAPSLYQASGLTNVDWITWI